VLAAVEEAAEILPDLPSALKLLGDRLLEEAKCGPPTRETALTLAAADTLMTLACELVAEQNPESLSDPFPRR
jgi:hypothetical protein